MPTPPYIRKLRERIGSDYLWLSGATAVVYREQDSKVLLVRRSDNGAWTPITGIVDPGESPALKIGRASCRERVKISVGGGALKKKEREREKEREEEEGTHVGEEGGEK